MGLSSPLPRVGVIWEKHWSQRGLPARYSGAGTTLEELLLRQVGWVKGFCRILGQGMQYWQEIWIVLELAPANILLSRLEEG